MVSQTLINDMVDFLNGTQTPAKTFVGLDNLTIDDEQLRYVTQVKGATLPMRIRLWNQPSEIGTDGLPKPGDIMQFQLLVNPNNMNHGKTNTVQAVYTRTGWVTQAWGPNQDSISITGKSAGFMVAGTGLTSSGERYSLGFHNLMALMKSYRNNGYQLMDPLKGSADNKHLNRVIEVIRGVEISYDGDSFIGHFNTFTFDEDATCPYLVNFNFEFVCSALTGFESETSQIRGHFVPAFYTQYSRGNLSTTPAPLDRRPNTLIDGVANNVFASQEDLKNDQLNNKATQKGKVTKGGSSVAA